MKAGMIILKSAKNSAQSYLHELLPNYVKPLCRDSDFICHNTNGLMKLADNVPSFVMDGLDVVAHNPWKTAAVVAVTTVSTVLLFSYCRYRKQTKAPMPAKKNDVLIGELKQKLALKTQ